MSNETKFTTSSTFDVARKRPDGKTDLIFGNKGHESDKGHAVFDQKGHPEFVRNPDEGTLGSAGGWNNYEKQ